MGADTDDHAIVQYKDLIRMTDSGRPLGNDKGGGIFLHLLQRLSEFGVRGIVQS